MKYTTLNTIVNDLLLIVRGSKIASSEIISKRQIEDWVHQYRAILIARHVDKNNYTNPDFIQEIPKLALELTDLGGEFFYSSVLNLPKTINRDVKSGYTWIGTSDGKELQLVPQHRAFWQQYKKYTPNDNICFLKDNKLYFKSNGIPISYITVRGIFENPMEVGRFINPETSLPYTTLDSPYPIPVTMLEGLKQMILSKELKIEVSAPSDSKNDSSHGVSDNTEKEFKA